MAQGQETTIIDLKEMKALLSMVAMKQKPMHQVKTAKRIKEEQQRN